MTTTEKAVVVVAALGGAYLLFRPNGGLLTTSGGSSAPTSGGTWGTGRTPSIAGTGETNPIAGLLSGLVQSAQKLLARTMVNAGPSNPNQAPGSPDGALKAGGTYTTGLPPRGDLMGDAFPGADWYDIWHSTDLMQRIPSLFANPLDYYTAAPPALTPGGNLAGGY